MADITVNVQIIVPNGPKINLNRTLSVEAFDKVDVTVPAGSTDMEVQLQPGAAGQVQLILVVADWYGADLTYKVNVAAGTARIMDQPHLFTGAGAVSLLDAGAPTSLFFGNATTGAAAKDAHVQILIGRDATP